MFQKRCVTTRQTTHKLPPPPPRGKDKGWGKTWGPTMSQVCSALATMVFIALSSVWHIMFFVPACPSVPWLGSGARTLPPLSTVPGQLSPIGLWECKHSARLTPMCLIDQRARPLLY